MALRDKIAFGISLPHRSPDRIDMADVKAVAQRAEDYMVVVVGGVELLVSRRHTRDLRALLKRVEGDGAELRPGQKDQDSLPPYDQLDAILQGYVEEGLASYYGKKFHGRRTASGELFNMYGISAAHRTLPIPSYARVTEVSTGKSVIVRVNDRGPFAHGRIIDLARGAGRVIGMNGVARVAVAVVD